MFADEANQSEPKTKEEWRTYITLPPRPRPTMPSFVEYEAMSELAREDFNHARDDCHSANVLVRTEAMKAIHKEITIKMNTNRRAPATGPGPRRAARCRQVHFSQTLRLQLRTRPAPQGTREVHQANGDRRIPLP